jgi:hypothetical protein
MSMGNWVGPTGATSGDSTDGKGNCEMAYNETSSYSKKTTELPTCSVCFQSNNGLPRGLVECTKCHCYFHALCDSGIYETRLTMCALCTKCLGELTLRCGCRVKRHSDECNAHADCQWCRQTICPKRKTNVSPNVCYECLYEHRGLI